MTCPSAIELSPPRPTASAPARPDLAVRNVGRAVAAAGCVLEDRDRLLGAERTSLRPALMARGAVDAPAVDATGAMLRALAGLPGGDAPQAPAPTPAGADILSLAAYRVDRAGPAPITVGRLADGRLIA
ncbi:MAG: hypothetical protein AAF677_18275 [Pseudomonadota bacterium]